MGDAHPSRGVRTLPAADAKLAVLSTLATDLAVSLVAGGLDRRIVDLTGGSPLTLAIEDTASRYGADQRSKVEVALREWATSGAFVALLREVHGGADADVVGRFTGSFRQRGGYHEVDPTGERTEAVLQRFVAALTRRLLASGDFRPLLARADHLADRLREVGEDSAAVRQHVDVTTSPDADWRRIEDHTRLWTDKVRDTIGGTVRLPRATERGVAAAVLGGTRLAVLVGESGTGKSAIAKALAGASAGPVVWASPQRTAEWTLTEWRSQLGLHRPVTELVSAATGEPLLVLDGLDRLYAPDAFDAVAEWLRAVRLADPDSPWRVVTTCTDDAWDRVRGALEQKGVSVPAASIVNVGAPAADELEAVWAAFPELDALRHRDHLSPVLRPKVLDLLAWNRGRLGDAARFGESDVARLFWTSEVAPPGHGHRSRPRRPRPRHRPR